MNRIGVFDNVRIGGSIFLYSGKGSTGILSSIFAKQDRGILTESFILDLSPSGLVRAYDATGLWKLRFIEFVLTAQGLNLFIFRPPKRSLIDKFASKNATEGQDYAAVNQAFADSIASGKAEMKSKILLSAQPLTVKKVHLTQTTSGGDVTFSLTTADSIRNTQDKATSVVSVIQLQLEGSGYLEFFGRDDEHLEKWMQRLRFVTIMHRSFHMLQKSVQNWVSFPAMPGNYEEFVVTVPGTQCSRTRSTLQVTHFKTSFSICIISQPDGFDDPVFWRVCFDENTILEPNSICFPVIGLTAAEQDQVSGGNESVLLTKEACWLSLESLSQAALGKLFYYNKWASFLGNFAKHFEDVNGSSWITSRNESRLRDVSSFAFSPSSRQRSLSSPRFGKAVDGSDSEDSVVLPPQPAGQPHVVTTSSSPTASSSREFPRSLAATGGTSEEVRVRMALQEEHSFSAAISSLSPVPSRADRSPSPPPAARQWKGLRQAVQVTGALSSSASKRNKISQQPVEVSSPLPGAAFDAPLHSPAINNSMAGTANSNSITSPSATMDQRTMERRAADERLCRRIPQLLGCGDVVAIMQGIAQFREKYQ